MKKINKIAIIAIPGIGNAILFTPALKQLRKLIPKAQIHILVAIEQVNEIFETCPYVDKVVQISRKKYNSFLENLIVVLNALKMRGEQYDLCITIFPSNRIEYNLLSFLIGAKYRLTHGYRTGKFRTLSFLQNLKVKACPDIHDVEQNLKLIELIGMKECEKETEIWLTNEDEMFAQNIVKNLSRPIIGLHPSSGDVEGRKGPIRDIENKFINIAKHLNDNYDCSIILFGGPNEKRTIYEMSHKINPKPLLSTGNTIRQTAALIKQCDLFINIESGLGHIASAVKTNSITIMGPTIKTRTRTYGETATNIFKDMPCNPCYKYPFYSTQTKIKCNNYKCFIDIDSKDILTTTDNKLQETGFK